MRKVGLWWNCRTRVALRASARNLLVPNPRSAISAALSLNVGGQLVRLAEEAAASTVLGSFALVVRHGVQASEPVVYIVCPCVYP